MHLALVRAEARDATAATAFLQEAALRADACEAVAAVKVYPPVPPPVARVADVERVQMLLESPSRGALQRFLADWQVHLHGLRATHKGVLRWAIDVDPLSI
jgi:primosomal protein N' (replication factor Y)